MNAGVCVHCGERIRQRISWPSGNERWFGPAAYPLCESSFCDAVDGNDHQPATGLRVVK